jgi:DNA-binding response OmpR family regulator
MPDGARILIVDDEPGLADLYAAWLSGTYDVETATSGDDALDVIDDTVDVVFLDRRMPGRSGDEVLVELRDRGLDAAVALVTAVDADFDVLELPLDAYLAKPVERDALTAAVERLHPRPAYDEPLRRYFSLVARRDAIEAATRPEERRANETYTELVASIESLQAELDPDPAALSEADAATWDDEY